MIGIGVGVGVEGVDTIKIDMGLSETLVFLLEFVGCVLFLDVFLVPCIIIFPL